MIFEILKAGKVIDSIEATDETSAFNDAMELYNGDIDDVREKGTKSRTPLQEIEGMRSDAEDRTPDSPPFLQRTPRTSDIIAESTRDGKMGPIAYKRFIEGENELLQNTLAAIPERSSSYAGEDVFRTGIGNTALGLLLPATAEAYANDRRPGWEEALLDAGLAAASIYASPALGASALSKVAPRVSKFIAPGTGAIRNALLEGATSGAISGLGEAVQSSMNGRDYNLTAPLLGAGVGGALGGVMTTSQAKKLADMGFSEEDIPEMISKLSTTAERTGRRINPGGKKDFGSTEIAKYTDLSGNPVSSRFVDRNDPNYLRFRGVEVGVTAENTYPLKEVTSKIANIRKSLSREYMNGMPTDTYTKKMDMLQAFEDKVKGRSDFLSEKELKYYVDLIEQNHGSSLTPILEKKFDEASKNPKVFGSGLLNDIQDVADHSLRTSLLQTIPKDKNLVAPLLAESKYANGVENLPDIIESGTTLQTAKNLLKAPPHVSKTAQQVLRPGARTLPQVGRSTDGDGNILYAPLGRISYEDLWEMAKKDKEKK